MIVRVIIVLNFRIGLLLTVTDISTTYAVVNFRISMSCVTSVVHVIDLIELTPELAILSRDSVQQV